MFRKRLRIKTGCIRCKQRRKKCDEAKPACGYCARWNVECSWPPGVQGDRSDNGLTADRIGMAAFDAFHELPIPNSEHRPYVTRYLRHYFNVMVSGALPFDILSTRTDMARGWARSACGDVAVCYAFAAYAARLQSQSAVGMFQERHALAFEAYTLAALRRRLNSEPQPTEHTILLACLHFVMLAFTQTDVQELCRISRGIGAMVTAYGGYARAQREMQFSTIQSMEINDMFYAFLNGTGPLYQQSKAPVWPRSMSDLYVGSWSHFELQHRCEAEVVNVVRDMNFVLFFREPSGQTRALSSQESLYLHQLLRYSENRLAFLQVRYRGAGTLCKVMIHGMIVLTREVVPLSAQHAVLTTAILGRLNAVISASSATALRGDSLHQVVMIWACVVALVGAKLEGRRAWFLEIIARLLQRRYEGGPWPQHWQDDLRKDLSSILWHARLEELYLRVCGILQNDEHIYTANDETTGAEESTGVTQPIKV